MERGEMIQTRALCDRLSSLPDPILHEILSRLPADEVVRTSALSGRWAHLWTHSNSFHFTSLRFTPGIIFHLLRRAPANLTISSLTFPLVPDLDPAVVGRWIDFSAARRVKELAFMPFPSIPVPDHVQMPPSLFHCPRLTALHLHSCRIPDSVPPDAFPLLRSLALAHVSIRNGLLEEWIKSCPRIESLSVSGVTDIAIQRIRAPTLRRLMVWNCPRLYWLDIVEAPELRMLVYSGDIDSVNIGCTLWEPQEVALLGTMSRFMSPSSKLVVIAGARVLSINNWFLEFPIGKASHSVGGLILFDNLKELHWWPVYKRFPYQLSVPWCAEGISVRSLRSLLQMLRLCPFLEHLCVKSTFSLEVEEDVNSEDKILFKIHEYSPGRDFQELEGWWSEFPCLKTVTITEFVGRREEMLLLEFLERKSPVLQSVHLHHIAGIESRLEVVRGVLEDFHRTSPHLQTYFHVFDKDKQCPKHDYMWFENLNI